MALSKSAVNKKYDELRAQLKSGELSQKAFKLQADRLYKMYHSKEAKAQRAKPAAKPKAAKPAAKPKAAKKSTKSEAAKRFYSSSSKGDIQKNIDKAKSNFFRSSSGTRGKLRPSNPPSPTVRRKGSTTGATVDPRERSLRKNLQESKSRKGSTSKGRRNIAAQVKEASGSSKRNQKLVQDRRRRAREEALKKNLREMFGSKYNN